MFYFGQYTNLYNFMECYFCQNVQYLAKYMSSGIILKNTMWNSGLLDLTKTKAIKI